MKIFMVTALSRHVYYVVTDDGAIYASQGPGLEYHKIPSVLTERDLYGFCSRGEAKPWNKEAAEFIKSERNRRNLNLVTVAVLTLFAIGLIFAEGIF